MKSIQMLVSGLCLSAAIPCLAQIITITAEVPACYERANTAAVSALKQINEKAEAQCHVAELIDLQVSISNVGGCTPVKMLGLFRCYNEQ